MFLPFFITGLVITIYMNSFIDEDFRGVLDRKPDLGSRFIVGLPLSKNNF